MGLPVMTAQATWPARYNDWVNRRLGIVPLDEADAEATEKDAVVTSEDDIEVEDDVAPDDDTFLEEDEEGDDDVADLIDGDIEGDEDV